MSISSILTRFRAPQPLPLQKPLDVLAQNPETLPAFVRACPVSQRALALLGPLPWSTFPEPCDARPWLHAHCLSEAALTAACLIRLEQHLPHTSHLVAYLETHPALLWLLGFPLVADPTHPLGFDPHASLPSQRQFNRRLRQMSPTGLQWLLDQTVGLLRETLAPHTSAFGETISLDTKHILAFVKENNPKAYVADRFNKTKQPKGDPDCKLGCKRRRNLPTPPPPPTPTTNPVPFSQVAVGEYYWGYGSGVVATKVAGWGEIVLAELTQPFNQSDVSYFFPLMTATERRLGFKPRFGAFDGAFDAFYVYEYFVPQDGLAAVPFAEKGQTTHRQFTPEGLPLCPAHLPMPVRTVFTDRTKTLLVHERARYACPLRYPTPTGETCPIQHARWPKGGCTVEMPTSLGARLRYQLDRQSDLYRTIYKQRTATERINAQAKALGIERPCLRNGAAITHLNTLIYVLINLRTLHRILARLTQTA